MKMEYVVSSSIAAVGYDESSRTMQVDFKHGTTYQYRDVPLYVCEELISASSVGSYFNNHVRDVYSFSKV